jgi:UDP-4-amino-4,6-dideoxy-N-acetyl-beta-L-altrosamine N-acetyltransferase
MDEKNVEKGEIRMNEMKIRLRPVTEGDLENIMTWRMKPEVTYFMNTDPVLTMDMQRAWFKKIQADETCEYRIIMAEGKDIGLIGILDIDHENRNCSWVWYIGEDDYRGKGIAKRIQLNLYDYVFYTLKMHKLYSRVLMINTHEIDNVHTVLGYLIEGVQKEFIYKNGQYIDVALFSIFERDWEEIKPNFEYLPVTFEPIRPSSCAKSQDPRKE